MNTVNFQARSAIKHVARANNHKDYYIEEDVTAFVYQIGVWTDTYEIVEKEFQLTFKLPFPKIGDSKEITLDGNTIKIFAVQPNKFIIESKLDISKPLSTLCDNVQSTMINQSSAFSVIKVSGKGAEHIMQKLCFFDFAASNSIVINTQMASAYNVMIEITDDGYRIFVTRTMARSLWDYIARIE